MMALLNSTQDWWTSLSTELMFFYSVAIIAMIVTFLQTLFALIGLGVEGFFGIFDLDISAADGSGIGIFSSHTISAFCVGFGWGGVLALQAEQSLLVASMVGTGGGLAMMFAMFFFIKGLLNLQSDGTLDYSNALGDEAVVYVTIPGNNQDGGGQVQVTIQGRLVTAAARSKSSEPIPPGQRVRIAAMAGATSFMVEPTD